MDDYTVELEQMRDGQVVLVVPALHLLVFGRNLEDAMSWLAQSAGRPTLFRQQEAATESRTPTDTAA